MIRAALTFVLLALPNLAAAVDCDDQMFEGARLTICEVDTTQEDLRLFLQNQEGSILGQFRDVARSLPEGQTLAFAMNAGMYHPDRSPVGLYIEDGIELAPLQTRASHGNFGLLPNGVFCITDSAARVYETLDFQRRSPPCREASQSGPMLVIDGALHPRFLEDSTSRFVRNGVGTTADGTTAYFVMANNPVTFHQFGRVFRDVLQTPNALYFDGKISRLYAPDLNRADAGFWMGPIVGVVTQTERN